MPTFFTGQPGEGFPAVVRLGKAAGFCKIFGKLYFCLYGHIERLEVGILSLQNRFQTFRIGEYLVIGETVEILQELFFAIGKGAILVFRFQLVQTSQVLDFVLGKPSEDVFQCRVRGAFRHGGIKTMTILLNFLRRPDDLKATEVLDTTHKIILSFR